MDYKKKVSDTLQHLQNKRGLTQKKLCKQGIVCSERHLRRILNGDVEPSPTVLDGLLEVLGVSLPEFTQLVYGEDMLLFQHDFSEIWDLLFMRKYEEADLLLAALKAKPYCNTSNPAIAQALLMHDGVLMNLKENFHESNRILYEAICMTSAGVLQKGEPNPEFVALNVLEPNEYRIIGVIAINLCSMGQSPVAIKIFEALCESLSNKKVDVETRNKLLPNIYYNLSDELIETKQYENALCICEKGIQLCERTITLKMLPLLLYNSGKALVFMGDRTQAEIRFRRSYDAFRVQGNEKSALRGKEMVAEKYKIFI